MPTYSEEVEGANLSSLIDLSGQNELIDDGHQVWPIFMEH